MRGARVKRAVLSLLDKLRGNVVRVWRTMHTIAAHRVAIRSDEHDRFVGVASENERREHDVHFGRHASVKVHERSRFGKENVLAVMARWF